MEGAELTREEYATERDMLARIVRDIDTYLADLGPDWGPDEGEDYDDFLDRVGYYITGDEYRQIEYAKRIFETLAGRNAARAL